jgi:hypothetical protein
MREYTDAFDILSNTRQSGMAPNPIPLTEVLAYLQLYGADDTEAFITYIQAMDLTFLDTLAKKAERDSKNAEHGAKRR